MKELQLHVSISMFGNGNGTELSHDFYRIPAAPGHWLLGNLDMLGKLEHHQIMTDWANRLGGIYHMRLAWVHVRLSATQRI